MKEFFSSIWNSETAFVRIVRSAFLALGTATTTAGASPENEVNIMATILMALGGIFGAGDKNAK